MKFHIAFNTTVLQKQNANVPLSGSVSSYQNGNGGLGEREPAPQARSVARDPLITPSMRLRSKLGEAYRRSDHHRWSYHEETLLVDVTKGHEWEKELAEILSYRERLTPDEARFFPKSIIQLLDKWGSILDRARAHQPAIIPQAAKSIATKQIEGMMRTMGGEI